MESAAVFAPTFIRGVFPQNRVHRDSRERAAPYRAAGTLQPGETAPLTVSWRQQGEQAAVVDYGAGTLPVPSN